MPDLIITVSPERVYIIREMVKARTGNEEMTDPEIIEWLEGDLLQHLKLRCGEHQQNVLDGTYVFNDPVP